MVEAIDTSQQDMAQANADGMGDTINARAHAPGEIDTSMKQGGEGHQAPAEAIDQDSWIEVRLSGKLPERRSNHCAFILTMKDGEYLYVHGGRDLKEGSIQSMWKVNLTEIQQLKQDPYYRVEWEQVETSGRGPGAISHHTAFVIGTKEVLFYGGLKGEDSNSEIFIFNATTQAWQTIHLADAASGLSPRDDHALIDCSNGSFMVFGGFVKGSRVNEILKFMPSSVSVNGEIVDDGSAKDAPVARASHSASYYADKMYIFGGQDDDNNKLGDLWQFDGQWTQLAPREGDYIPIPRSGHTSVVFGQKMYIFGGIYELTKELNDMVVFDFSQMRFLKGEEPPEFLDVSPEKIKNQMQQDNFTESSPTRTNRKDGSPGRRKTLGFGYSMAAGGSPMRSPNKRKIGSPSRKERSDVEKQDGLGTPTSISMQNRFIIKNADPSFDQYYHQMKKRKQHGFGASGEHGATGAGQSKFGIIQGSKPTARDGHTAVVDSQGYMYVFGGDRHHMPFNDLYMIKLV